MLVTSWAALLIAFAASVVSSEAHGATPIAAYSFDEGSGSTLNDSANDHDGSVIGATWTSVGKYGSALEFDGTNDLVTIADSAELDFTSSFTLAAWVRPDTLPIWKTIVGKASTVGGNSGYLMSARGPYAGPGGHVGSAGISAPVNSLAALPTGSWSHVAVTSDGTNLRLYNNGALTTTASAIAASPTSADLVIGHNQIFNTYFDGLIDEVRLYDVPLTLDEIQVDRDTRVEPSTLRKVTTSTLDSGPSAEKVSSVPVTTGGVETVAYSLPVPDLTAKEVLRLQANVEVTNNLVYDVATSIRVVLGTSATDTNGTVISPWSTLRQTPDMQHWTLPVAAMHEVPETLGTRHLKVVLKSSSPSAQPGAALIVQPNFGRLAVTRSLPTSGAMSQPVHAMQPLLETLPALTTSIPVNSSWQRVMTRKVDGIAENDILDLAAQLEVQNTSSATVQLESKITRSATPSTAGPWASPPITYRLSAKLPSARVVHSNHMPITDSDKPYINLAVRAIPVSGSPSALAVTAGTASLDLVRHKPDPGEASAPLDEATRMEQRSDFYPDVTSIPYAVGSAPQPTVVASAPLYGTWKGEVLQARGLVTGDLAGADKAQLLTSIIVADSPTATTGDLVGVFSGDKFPADAQVHTVVKEGMYVVPAASKETTYVNLVARASRVPAYSGEAMDIDAGALHVTRSRTTAPLNEGFEDGLDALWLSKSHGTLEASALQAREGNKSLLTNLDFSSNVPESNPFNLHNEVRPPDDRSSGGYEGENSWYGFSAYFPDEDGFTVGPDSGHFDGKIDEVRFYDQALSPAEVVHDRDGAYSETPAPVAEYGFDEGAGTTVADGVGANDGDIDGATWTAIGKYGSALNFDGVDDRVVIPDADALDLTDTFTIEAWVRPDAVGVWDPIVTKALTESYAGYRLLAAGAPLYHSEQGAPGSLVGTAQNAWKKVEDSGPLPTGSWSHVALTADSGVLRLYVDGEEVATASGAAAPVSASDVTIGASDVPGGNAAVLDTIFMQWHGSNEGLDCNMVGGRPPISFHVRRFQAGQWTNPGETETATPVTGDYIYVQFTGGEVDEMCEALHQFPFETYVLAPLERERWYDFVLHTTWTTSPGTPQDSVAEVWLDGERLVGDEEHPVLTPNLYWHGSPAIRNPITSMNFGIYRHVSGAQPQSHLFVDAVRRGNSYADVAPGQ